MDKSKILKLQNQKVIKVEFIPKGNDYFERVQVTFENNMVIICGLVDFYKIKNGKVIS